MANNLWTILPPAWWPAGWWPFSGGPVVPGQTVELLAEAVSGVALVCAGSANMIESVDTSSGVFSAVDVAAIIAGVVGGESEIQEVLP